MKKKDFIRFCFSNRLRTFDRMNILRDEILQDPLIYKELFKNTEKVVDLKLMEIIGYSFICALQKHLKPESDRKYISIIRLLEKKLKCFIPLKKYEIKIKDSRSIK